MQKINIYECGPDFYAAKNLRDAVREIVSDRGESIREVLEEIKLVPDPHLDRLQFLMDPENDMTVKMSFRERLNQIIKEGERFPCAFASSEW